MNKQPLPPIPVILGQTASGKTSIGIQLAKQINGEIISVDSRKIYKGIPIGTATPHGKWVGGAYYVEDVAHHLMGCLSPDQHYTAGDFAKDAQNLIYEILTRKKRPILVGGTGFYFKALSQGLPNIPNRDPALRLELNRLIVQKGLDHLYNELNRLDPAAAQAISKGDRHKIIRALEVIQLTGKPFSSLKNEQKKKPPFHFIPLGLKWDKDVLIERIKIRSRRMERNGMIKEAKKLLEKGFSRDCPALASFGFRDAVHVIEGKLDPSEFLPLLIKGTVAYAKRQQTWFRTQLKLHWIDLTPITKKEDIVLKMNGFLNNPAMI